MQCCCSLLCAVSCITQSGWFVLCHSQCDRPKTFLSASLHFMSSFLALCMRSAVLLSHACAVCLCLSVSPSASVFYMGFSLKWIHCIVLWVWLIDWYHSHSLCFRWSLVFSSSKTDLAAFTKLHFGQCCRGFFQSVNQSKHICIVPYVMIKSVRVQASQLCAGAIGKDWSWK